VVWGAPLEHLSKYIDEYHPVAVFSFGQGGPNTFALESRASRERGGSRDNRGEKAQNPAIAEDGPSSVNATIDCEKLKTLLAAKGYPIRVSTNAGQYLCEECLYTLEYLKVKKSLEGTVMFCHVPPLKTKVEGQEVTTEYVQRFVEDVLAAWHTLYQKSDDARQKEVKEFIGRYF